MSRVAGKNTDIELAVFALLRAKGLRFRKHAKNLPGRPDAVISSHKIAIFVDGDFWHGYRFPLWEREIPAFWRSKIAKNRARDQVNFAALRRRGWKVVRIWGHQVKSDSQSVVSIIDRAVENADLQVHGRD